MFDFNGGAASPSTFFCVGSPLPATFTLDTDGYLRSGEVATAACPEAERMRAFSASAFDPRA
jgi:hypothetical protein